MLHPVTFAIMKVMATQPKSLSAFCVRPQEELSHVFIAAGMDGLVKGECIDD